MSTIWRGRSSRKTRNSSTAAYSTLTAAASVGLKRPE